MKTKTYAVHLTGAEVTLIVAALKESRYAGCHELAGQVLERAAGKRINHACACGKLHEYIPANARRQGAGTSDDPLDGWYWNCSCGSTMFEGFL